METSGNPVITSAPRQAATNEQVGGCDHPATERNQR